MLGGAPLPPSPPLDLSAILPYVFSALFVLSGFVALLKNASSRYFSVEAPFVGGDRSNRSEGSTMSIGDRGEEEEDRRCVVCRDSPMTKCGGCNAVLYCSIDCQSKHWKEDHQLKCKKRPPKHSIALIPGCGPSRTPDKVLRRPKTILFPYEEFMKLFYWDEQSFPPCGLFNCGNSCFANVVLQCLSCTRPLVAYLLDGIHARECRRNAWCFLCEIQRHIKRVKSSFQPFSPMSILSRLPSISSNLGHGRQEDAHEFMRFAVDTMQSICLDDYGGEKALDVSTQETTLVHHVFGGHLQSQVICTNCNQVSNRYENMMDLTVEIHGDADSLQTCLDQFTAMEWLDGDNKYKCDGCNDYVKACKQLTIHQAPNILTIALKRFQSGRFGKLNKRVTFPETLDLAPYMSDVGDAANLYSLYAIVVHLDMMNASFFGHYICYTKDFSGQWYRIDDCEVMKVDVEEVLSQGAYMLLYSRSEVRRPKTAKASQVDAPAGQISSSSVQTKYAGEGGLMQTSIERTSLTASTTDTSHVLKMDTDIDELPPSCSKLNCFELENQIPALKSEGHKGQKLVSTENSHGDFPLKDISSILNQSNGSVGSSNGFDGPSTSSSRLEASNARTGSSHTSQALSGTSSSKVSKPLFARGFLDRPSKKKSLQLTGDACIDRLSHVPEQNGQINGSCAAVPIHKAALNSKSPNGRTLSTTFSEETKGHLTNGVTCFLNEASSNCNGHLEGFAAALSHSKIDGIHTPDISCQQSSDLHQTENELNKVGILENGCAINHITCDAMVDSLLQSDISSDGC